MTTASAAETPKVRVDDIKELRSAS
jgi:hypothetical protein